MKNAELSIVRKNGITYVFLISAWMMIMLHAFFPHHHVKCCEIDVEKYVCDVLEQEDPTFYNLLQHIFSNNSGEESLHHFSQKLGKTQEFSVMNVDLDSDDYSDYNFSLAYSFDYRFFPLQNYPLFFQKELELNTREVFQDQFTSLSISFRGPPFVASIFC